MSAEVLREAAALMRERAEAATGGPWFQNPEPRSAKVRSEAIDPTEFDDEIAATLDVADAEHIASWHPAVALAVADWLDWVADGWSWNPRPIGNERRASAVARAYLGSDS